MDGVMDATPRYRNEFLRPDDQPRYRNEFLSNEQPAYRNEPPSNAGLDIYSLLAQLLGQSGGPQRAFPGVQGGQPPLGFGLEMLTGGWPAAEQRALLADPMKRARFLGPGNVPAPFSMSPGLFGFGR